MNQFEKMDILLVEDNPYDAELSMLALQQKKLADKVEWVQDGADALDFIFCEGAYADRPHHQTLRLILLDIKLPKVSGIEVLRRIKSDPKLCSIPVVMLTSSAQESDLNECYALGVNSYIVKPVNVENFEEEIQKAGCYWMQVNQLPNG